MSERKAYPSDLSDGQWDLIKDFVPATKPGGRPETHTRREVVNAILSILRAGCAWRMMPHDLPPKETAYACYALWSRDGTWKLIEGNPAREGAPGGRQEARAHGGDPGQPECQDQRSGRAARLRRGQANRWAQAASPRGHPRED